MIWLAALFILLCAAVYFAPLFRPVRPVLPVILLEKTACRPENADYTLKGIPLRRIERLFAKLQKKGFHTVLPEEILSGRPLPQNPVLLVYSGGYATIYSQIAPLLEKYQLKAAVALPVGWIGQYNSWETSPWQDVLNVEQIRSLSQTGRIAFISQTMTPLPLPAQPQDAYWQLSESAHRLKNNFKLNPQAVLLAEKTPKEDILARAREIYPLVITHQGGNNLWPAEAAPLRIFRLSYFTNLQRLCWKLRRI